MIGRYLSFLEEYLAIGFFAMLLLPLSVIVLPIAILGWAFTRLFEWMDNLGKEKV